MKIKEITLRNFSKYEQVTVSFDENVTYLIGKNGSGKSTIGITGVQAIFQGIAEKASGGNNPLIGERFRFIGPKAATSTNQIILVDEQRGNAEIKITRKITKSGSDLQIVAPEGYGDLDQAWLNNLFNLFLIAPKKFTELSPKDQAKALGINTKDFDDAIADLKKQYTEINAVYRSFGELPPVEEVQRVEVAELQKQKDVIRETLNNQYKANKALNDAARAKWERQKAEVDNSVTLFNQAQDEKKTTIDLNRDRRHRIAAILDEMKGLHELVDLSKLDAFITGLPQPEPKQVAAEKYPPEPTLLSDKPVDYQPAEDELVYVTEMPDDSELKAIDAQIIEAGETNNKALLYEQYLQKKQTKDEKAAELLKNKKEQEAKEQERIDYIKAFKFPFSNLTVGEDGELLLSGKPIKEPYFSTGELLKVIPILLSTTNPELKYVFIQGFKDLDEDNWAQVESYLLERGFQLVVEMVGKEKLSEKNCILLKDSVVVDSYDEEKQPTL